jgi:hypothetical protein
MAKHKRSKKPNEFATLLGVITILLVVGFLVQSTIMVYKKDPISKVFSSEQTTAIKLEEQSD